MPELVRGLRLHERFTLLSRLGRGGMSEVWLVRDAELGCELAAKIVATGVEDSRIAALQRECRAARRLTHSNIVPVFDFHRGTRYHLITMAHIEGRDISSLRGASTDQILSVAVRIADALDHAHGRGVVHRDLKASNVLLDTRGEPQLLDFGIGGLLDEPETTALAGGGSRYNVSPQQLDGVAPQPADDIYAFGALLYELLAGAPPFWPDISPGSVRTAPPPAIAASVPLPPELRTLVESLLAKEPADRPADMVQVRATLLEIAEALPPARPPGVDKSSVRLNPPPRARPVRPIAPSEPSPVSSASAPRDAGRRRALGLLAIAAAVFSIAMVGLFLMPKWTSDPVVGRVESSDPPAAPIAIDDRRELEPPIPPDELEGEEQAAPERAAVVAPLDPGEEIEAPPDEDRFAEWMSLGLASLKREEYGAAHEAFERALSLRPGSPGATDGLLRADAAEKLATITRLREEAARLEAEESWSRAAELYATVLELDDTVRFAQQGEERSLARADLQQRLARSIADPDRLSAEPVLREAVSLLDEARESDPSGPRHMAQIDRLDELIGRASLRVSVNLESDERTDVTVYRVGRLGKFKSHALELRPGTYTVVGSRSGYRDVRRTLVVVFGERPEPLVVSCLEKI